jgi:hypothetical protein
MAMSTRSVRELVREARAAIGDVARREPLVRAWELLQERDANQNAKGARSYTDAALAALHIAHEVDPDDMDIVHHLAIATHSRAWDWELAGNPQASAEWERALGLWRAIASSGSFWSQLTQKVRTSGADPSFVADMRKDLLENVLDIHVGFVRHYCDSDAPGRAIAHVELVRRARIPPAVKKRLVDKIFEAMTASVDDSTTTHEYDSALASIERFLRIFPDHLGALRRHGEVARICAEGLSYQDDWNRILALSRRVEPFAQALAAHAELQADPLARSALEEETAEFSQKGLDRACSHKMESEAPISLSESDAGYAALDFALKWCRLGCSKSPPDSRVRAILCNCCGLYAFALRRDALEVTEQVDVSDRDKKNTVIRLLRQATTLLDEAVAACPDQEGILKFREACRADLVHLEGVLW